MNTMVMQYEMEIKGTYKGEKLHKILSIYERTDSLAYKRAIELANMFLVKCNIYSVKILKSELREVV